MSITVMREALYEEVWTTPATVLARKYNVSDVALIKACRRHQVPRPPRGHWAKLAAGRKMPRTPLPAITDARLQEVRFTRNVAGQQGFHDPDLSSLSDKLQSVPAAAHEGTHQFVVQVQQRLKEDESVPMRAFDRRTLAIDVSKGAMARFLRILNDLAWRWEAAGGKLEIDRTSSHASKDCIRFVLAEDRIESAWEERAHRQRPKGRPWSWEYIYNGQLVLRLDNIWAENQRATWSDGKRQRLEDMADSILTGLLQHIDSAKHHRLTEGRCGWSSRPRSIRRPLACGRGCR
jgi:hypothetical protein